ncbi:MAG: hypothetical protein LBV43_07985 [Prevotella sp.]|jgi:hypothetical protein|nr:hypothetical protein [Prevotella sp.]
MNKSFCNYILFCFFLLSFNLYPQDKQIEGVFKFKGKSNYQESITIHKNGQFSHQLTMNMGISLNNVGNWQQRDSILILDSYPQKDKIIVFEAHKKKNKEIVINVKDKGLNLISYHLYAITEKRDTLLFMDQFERTKIKEKIISFWIIDTKGLKSPKYEIKSKYCNSFDVLFEVIRVFENEHWIIIDNNMIQSRGLEGKLNKYYLQRKPSNVSD